jgi:hypothetical protein
MKKSIFLLTYALLLFLICFNVSGQVRDLEAWKKHRSEYESQFPVVNYDADELKTVEEIAQRAAKSKRYDNSHQVRRNPHPNTSESTRVDEIPRPPDIPILESRIVVVGEVLNSQAYLSNDKSGVYSEFNIRIEEVIKNNDFDTVIEGSLITADRMGGLVKYPNGQKILYSVDGKALLRKGRRYVLFLWNNDKSPNYYLLRGYELTATGALPLDGGKKFEGIDETNFKKTIREEIAKFSKELPTNE